MFYKYETHLHTSEGSKCAHNTGAEMVRAYKEAGFTGIFVTDHFFNGNCAVPRDLDWEQRVNLFMVGYESAKNEGDKLGFDVFFGWEFTYQPYCYDFLTYNLGKDFLLAYPNIDKYPIEEYSELVHENGGLLIQAHPYREASYIHYPPIPQTHVVDGIEVINSQSDSPNNHNNLAWELARKYPNLIRTSGMDIHSTNSVGLAGVAFRYRIKDSQHFIEALRAGDGYLIIDGKITDREGKQVEED